MWQLIRLELNKIERNKLFHVTEWHGNDLEIILSQRVESRDMWTIYSNAICHMHSSLEFSPNSLYNRAMGSHIVCNTSYWSWGYVIGLCTHLQYNTTDFGVTCKVFFSLYMVNFLRVCYYISNYFLTLLFPPCLFRVMLICKYLILA